MRFNDWMLTKDKSYVPTDDSMSLRLLRECLFIRDAEIAELRNLPIVKLLTDSEKECDKLREQVALLRDALENHQGNYKLTNEQARKQSELLAATEPR